MKTNFRKIIPLIILSLPLGFCAVAPSISNAELRIIDADTIELHGKKIRFSGIDAPEINQLCRNAQNQEYKCGLTASRSLEDLIAQYSGLQVTCSQSGKDFFDRVLAECFIGYININSWLVSNGWALAYRKYSPAYVGEEQSAQESSKGLWQGEFVKPWDWRRGIRLSSTEKTATQGCKIKGNISSSGEKIFHVIGASGYMKTKISPNKGERWFCSEEDAIRHGWRKSKR